MSPIRLATSIDSLLKDGVLPVIGCAEVVWGLSKYWVLILCDNCCLSLPGATFPRVRSVCTVGNVNTLNYPARSGSQ